MLNSSFLTDESETVDVKRGIGQQKINIVTGLRLHKNTSVITVTNIYTAYTLGV